MKQIGKLKIISGFRPADRLNELEEVPKIGDYIDYWQAAKMLCEKDGGHLATREELAQIVSEIYVNEDGSPVTIGKDDDVRDLQVKDEYEANPSLTLGYYWSSEECYAYTAYGRYFTTTGSNWYYGTKSSSGYRAVCIANN